MTDQSDLERYQGALVDWFSSKVSPKHLKGLALYSDEDYELIDTVFRHFTELTDCVDRLDLCISFIRAPMPRRKGVKADDYLMYHITFYLQEVYVLGERFRAYAKGVLRLRKRRVGLREGESKAVDEMLAFIRDALSSVALTRGKHVHKRAFHDENMRDLSMFAFLSTHNADNPDWQPIAKHLYRISRSHWVEQITKSRDAVTEILNVYSDLMYKLVFDASSGLLPNNSFKPKPLRGSV